MIKHINSLIWTTEFIEHLFTRQFDTCAQMLGQHVERDWIVSPGRFEADEYLLNMEISTSKKDVEQYIYGDLLPLVNESLMKEIKEGKTNAFTGIDEIFNDIHTQYSQILKWQIGLEQEGKKLITN